MSETAPAARGTEADLAGAGKTLNWEKQNAECLLTEDVFNGL